MFYQLPPAGNKVAWQPEQQSPEAFCKAIKPFNAFFFDSGAASLAVAIKVAIQHKKVAEPEVLLPAYACPELVSAILYAGAKPVLVDLAEGLPWLDLVELSAKLSANTVAVIAVNLFGIAERLQEIRSLTKQAGCLLIEDSAQAFPHRDDSRFWQGDLIVVSFGRGKPVSLLGGGAVFVRDDSLAGHAQELALDPECSGFVRRLKYYLKIFLYNRLLHPRLYFFPSNLPLLKLGETRFKPLQKIGRMSQINLQLLDCNYSHYQQSENAGCQQRLFEIVQQAGVDSLQRSCSIDPQKDRLIRFPVILSNKKQRDLFYNRLKEAGLGVSKMYRQPLNDIEGLTDMFRDQGEMNQARHFADRLITLADHSGVKAADLEKVASIMLTAR